MIPTEFQLLFSGILGRGSHQKRHADSSVLAIAFQILIKGTSDLVLGSWSRYPFLLFNVLEDD